MTTAYEIPRDMLRASLILAATNDIRYYLNGVFVQCNEKGEGRIVATDGNILGLFSWAQDLPNGSEPISIIIPWEAIAAAHKDIYKGMSTLLLRKGKFEERDRWILGNTVFDPIGGTFPDYVRVLPSKVTKVATQINVELLARFGKVADIMHRSGAALVRVGHNRMPPEANKSHSSDYNDGAALIEISGVPNFIGIVMPMRSTEADTPSTPPQWALQRIMPSHPISKTESETDSNAQHI